MSEIIIRQGATPTTEPEPSLTLTQLSTLLRDAAALERASRPVVLTGPETHPARPLPAPYAAPAPETAPAPAGPLSGPVHVPRLYLRSEISLVFFIGTGLSAALATLITGNGDCAALILLSLIGAATSTAALNRAHTKHEREHGPRAHHGVDRHGCPVTEA